MNEPRTQTVALKKGKTIIGRLLPGTDLIKGIEKICTDHQITYGTIITALGSLTRAEIVYAVPEKTSMIGIAYSKPTRVDGPLELLACQGLIGLNREKQLSIHMHGLMSDPNMKVFGGHFIENGNPILATAEIMIQENQDVEMIREPDDETGFPLFKFYPVSPG